MDIEPIKARLAAAIDKLPKWVRHDLASADPQIRQRAEEGLAAMILAALGDGPAERPGS